MRQINGGTVFKITYEPEEAWDNAMKGAFEYACKIWEEQLPNTLPINIHAKIGVIRGSNNGKLLSKVQPTSYNFYNTDENLSSRIKYVLLEEYNTGYNATFTDSIVSGDFFNKPDITITYNKNMLDEFSYSLYNTPVDKYDFVTVVLRDIAKGLGFISGFTANSSTGAFQNLNKPTLYFEKIIKEALGTENIHVAYQNATRGTLSLQVPYYGNLNLYAPNDWQNGVSLNYFIPDSTKNITEILNYQLGRGSVIRNITDNYNKLFQYLQGWQTYNITTGYNDRVSSSGSTNNKFAYNGSINIALNSIASNSNNQFDNKITLCETISENTQNQNENFILSNYLFPYDYKYPDSGGSGSWLISLLKKDGTWDLVYRQDTGGFDILYTQFAIYSYNNNGSTKSDYLTIEPLYTVQQLFDIQLESNEIFLTYNNRRALPKNVKYNIYSTNFNNVSILKKGVIESENSTIDISEINSGNYILRIYADGIQQNLKFSK